MSQPNNVSQKRNIDMAKPSHKPNISHFASPSTSRKYNSMICYWIAHIIHAVNPILLCVRVCGRKTPNPPN
jgi:hypothetical protein